MAELLTRSASLLVLLNKTLQGSVRFLKPRNRQLLDFVKLPQVSYCVFDDRDQIEEFDYLRSQCDKRSVLDHDVLSQPEPLQD